MAETKDFTLSRPITVHGKGGPEKTQTMTFREPSAGDLFALGLPFSLTTGEMKIEKVHDWLRRLGTQPESIVALAPADVWKIHDWLVEQLAPPEPPKKTADEGEDTEKNA